MKLTIKENRELIMVNAKSTQNENDVETIQIAVPERYSDFNKKIVFVTNDGTVWDFIEEDNTYKLKHAITKNRQVDFYIWLTKDEKDFRSVTKTLKFNHNKDANEEITDDEISGYNRMINILEDEITTVTGLETDLTNMINDIQNKLDAGYFKGEDGKTPKRGVDYWTNEDKEEIVQDVEEDIESILAEKVDKEEGKGLSSNDYTTAEKAKLSGIATGAEVNVIENIKVNDVSQTVTNKEVNIMVPTKTSDLNNDSGFGTYSKPSGGIPKTDLATDVQTSLGKADTALQSHQDISGKEDKSNKVTELTNESTDTQYPSAKAVYDELESLKAENEDLQQQVEDLENNQRTGTATGTSIYIDDSASAKNKSIGLTGNTTQDGTPTPENPVEIKNTGDNGSVNEKVQNKNLLPSQSEFEFGDISSSNGQNTSSDIYIRTKGYIQVSVSTNYRFSSLLTTSNAIWNVYEYDENLNYIKRSYQPYNITTQTNTKYIRFAVGHLSPLSTITLNDLLNDKMMLEEGSTASEYQAHEEQNISFPLAHGQKFMQGDYLADDGVHHVMGEFVLDGTKGGYNSDYNWYYIALSTLGISVKSFKLLSNYFKNISYSEFSANQSLNGISYNASNLSQVTHILIRNASFTNVEEYKTWLARVLPIVQYELAEEVIDPYTEEQQIAWEEIKKTRTYNPVTHISSEDETPATVNIEYVKDTTLAINEIIDEKIGNAIGGAY